jgi:hypothetical protein
VTDVSPSVTVIKTATNAAIILAAINLTASALERIGACKDLPGDSELPTLSKGTCERESSRPV